ncbi:MAG: hypothetical protein DPW09_36185 [Anaerolineae bacterium]|nr:hypothetical protein [Anaerolineales bacterium]MCQ3978894.1 hypothetical protein [Anaerolineae bacterium]
MSISDTIRARIEREMNRKNSLVHLQRIGKVAGKPAQEFKPGEFMMWNFGGVSRVEGVVKETPTYITFNISWPGKGNSWNDRSEDIRRLKKTRLVAIASAKFVLAATRDIPAEWGITPVAARPPDPDRS